MGSTAVRAARVEDHRRHLREKRNKWKFRLQRFVFDGVPSLGREELSFSSPLTVICGPNGVGKTTLLRAMLAAAGGSAGEIDPLSVHKLPSGSATLGFAFEDTTKESTVVFTSAGPTGGTPIDVDVIHLDIASGLAAHQKYFCTFESGTDLTNGAGAKELQSKELEVLNYLARRNYRAIRLYEVDGGDGLELPYFEIELGDSSYDSRTMGAGEFALFHLWWAITRAPINALILIEEPECHLSPGSQSALCDFLLRMADEKMLTIVMTTHSSQVVSRLDEDNLVYLYRDEKGVQIVRGQPSPSLLETVGIDPVIDAVAFVEDRAAVQFGRFLLQEFRPDLARRTEFVDRQGEGNITTALRASAEINSVRLIGLYDGDVRNNVPDDVKTRAVFLPGDEAIEKCLRKMLEADVDGMKVALGRPDLGQILFGIQGADPHDWLQKLCQALGQSQEQLLHSLFRIWLRQDGNEKLAKTTVEELAALYKP